MSPDTATAARSDLLELANVGPAVARYLEAGGHHPDQPARRPRCHRDLRGDVRRERSPARPMPARHGHVGRGAGRRRAGATVVGLHGRAQAHAVRREPSAQTTIGTVPPSADQAAPVTLLARALHRKTTTSAISRGSARRPSGIFPACAASASSRRAAPRRGDLLGQAVGAGPQLRGDGAGRDRVDEHVVRRVGVGEDARERQLRGLGHRVGGVGQRRALAGARADVDDPPAAALRPSAARPRA